MTCDRSVHLDGVAAIFVLYLASPQEIIDRLEWMTVAGGSIILIDNTPGRTEKIQNLHGVYHYCLGENKGIATALNKGLEVCRQLRAKYIFTFDQDSIFDFDLINLMLTEYKNKKEQHHAPLALGPFPVNKTNGASYLRRSDSLRVWMRKTILFKCETKLLAVKELITSGLLADDTTYAAVGPYKDELFIDFVDHEWTWRLTRAGGHCFIATGVKMAHMIGAGDIPFTAGMRLGSPNRIFYLFRNALFLALTGKMPIYDATKFLLLVPVKFLVFGMLSDRKQRWENIFRGIKAGVKSALNGRIEPNN